MSRTVRTLSKETPPEELAAVIREDGCVVIANLAKPDVMSRLLAEMQPHLDTTRGGDTDFLGRATRRAGALIARSPSARNLVTQPVVLETMERALGDHGSTYQIDLTQIIDIGPGEPGSKIHQDQWVYDRFAFPDGFIAEIGTMWAATDFTEEMGATRLVVGSHLWEDQPDAVDVDDTTPAVMTKGSVLLYVGSLYHGGGANKSNVHRIGVNIGYSLGWLRQEENQYLACPPEVARTLPEGLLRLMGYHLGAVGLGYVDNMRNPIDWLYDLPSVHSDYYAYMRTAKKALKRTDPYPPIR